jgi:triacylglycerol esterase/lipase EstA (alpha/beta hydrolase family)/cytoskeletal protein RodZ
VSTKSLYWWLRLAVAAFLLSAWVAVGLGSGIAHADETSSSADSSSSEGSEGSPASKPSKPDRRKDPAETADATAKSSSPADEGEAAEKTEADSDPDEPPQRHTPHGRPSLTVVSTKTPKPAKLAVEDPQPAASKIASVTSTPSAPDPQPVASKIAAVAPTSPTSDPQPAAPKIAAVAPSVSTTPSSDPPIRLPQPREVVGLVSDVGVVAMSAVWTAADTVAQIFGPHSFFGVPYALATAVANSAAAVSRTLIGAPPDAVSTGPFRVTYGIIDGLAFFNPQQPPPGANDPSITVTPEHPLPIILLNGTTGTQGANWSVGAPVLANAGYKVYTFNYGNVTNDPNFPIQATDDIRQSALELDAEIDRVLAETGAPKVILIGHSQGGGILPVYYINNVQDGADKVSQLIGIAPSNHGTDAMGLVGLQALPIFGPLLMAVANALGPALEQQALGNEFQDEVYGNGDTRPGVLYTTITSIYDEIVTPYTQQALDGPNVTNIVVQDLYPGVTAGHEGVVLSPQVWSIVLDALASNAEANPLAQNEELVA